MFLPHTKDGNYVRLMDVVTNYNVIISQHMHILNHYVVHLKQTVLFANYMSISWWENENSNMLH